MKENCKISSRSPRGRKATQFKSGIGFKSNTLRAASCQTSDQTAEDPVPISSTPSLKRITAREADDVQFISNVDGELAYTLRPRPEEVEKSCKTAEYDENVIVNIGKMEDLLQHMHQSMCKKANIKASITKRVGLCVYMSISCKFCGYKSPHFPMSDTVKQKKGPAASVLNTMAVVPVLKSKMGLDDVANVLSCLNVKHPCKATLQRKMNFISKHAIQLNENSMKENQAYVARVLAMAGAEPSVDVQFDVAYTVRPQGGCEKAAQSFGAMIEHTTTRKLPIAIAIGNKHCRRKGCQHNNCAKNYPTEKSIAASERILLHQSLDKVDQGEHLNIRSITTDAGTQSAKAIRDYYIERKKNAATHYKCMVHKLRTLERHLRQLTFKSIPKNQDKQAYLRKLAASTRARVRLELTRLRKSTRSTADFVRKASLAIQNIVRCFSGNHQNCRQQSRVCTGNVYVSYHHLPYGGPLKLSENDLKDFKNKLAEVLDEKNLNSICKLCSTNMCESLNAAVFNYAPKTTCWTRNFSALCHSATHSRTIGAGKSTVQLAAALGVPVSTNSITYKHQMTKDRLRHYNRLRQSAEKYKQVRYYLRKRKVNRSLFEESLYATENAPSCSASDHSYGLKA